MHTGALILHAVSLVDVLSLPLNASCDLSLLAIEEFTTF